MSWLKFFLLTRRCAPCFFRREEMGAGQTSRSFERCDGLRRTCLPSVHLLLTLTLWS